MNRGPLLTIALLVASPSSGGAQPNRSDNPHGSLRTTADCGACHTANAWIPLKARPEFDHNAASSFHLVGKHAEAKCKSCHLDLRFDTPKIAASDCASCHLDVHLGQLTSECANCHTTRDFRDIPALAIHSRTAFPLSGSHLQISCESCHIDDRGGAYSTLLTECIACHQADYAGAERVDHVAQSFPTECERCHNTLVWSGGGGFDHLTASSGFTLSGAHASLGCAQCHDPNSNALLFPAPSGQDDCVACHERDYERQHGASGTPSFCVNCHNDLTWESADFDHTTSPGGFALLGAHATLDCTVCHDPGSNALLFPPPSGQDDCVACHQDDYDRQHSGTGFPTGCIDCHTQTTWTGATFQHDQFFPINSGIHSGKWNGCDTCHNVPNDYTSFTCFNCHQHSQTRMDSKHSDVGGYTYESSACYSCHPNGRR